MQGNCSVYALSPAGPLRPSVGKECPCLITLLPWDVVAAGWGGPDKQQALLVGYCPCKGNQSGIAARPSPQSLAKRCRQALGRAPKGLLGPVACASLIRQAAEAARGWGEGGGPPVGEGALP